MIVLAGLDHDEHNTGPHHPERPARLKAAIAAIDDAGAEVGWVGPRTASHEELVRVHDADHLAAVERYCAEGGGRLDPDTPVVSGSWQTALESAGAGLAAMEAVASGLSSAAFVLTRPPGHHANRDRSRGFCLLNNIAVTAAALAEAGERVAIVDWDVHHGNGTQEIFWNDPRVVYVSTHQWPWYPGTGGVTETGGPAAPGTTVNIPVPAGTSGDVLLSAIDSVVEPVLAAFAPTWVLVSAGFDAHRADPLADLALTAGDFADLTGRVIAMAPRTILFLEGGYDLDALRLSVGASLGTLAGTGYRPEHSSNGGPGSEAVAAARRVHIFSR